MKVPVPTNEEIAFRQCLEITKLNPLMMSTYYSTLFATFNSLLDIEDTLRLHHMISDIEIWLSDEYNKMTLKEAEILMYNNMDLNSGFQVKGKLIIAVDFYKTLADTKTL